MSRLSNMDVPLIAIFSLFWKICLGVRDPNVLAYVKDEILRRNLKNEYRNDVGPFGQSEVEVHFHLRSLLEYNEIEGEVTASGLIVIQWSDSRLAWNNSELTMKYNETFHNMPFKSTEIWKPQVLFLNALKDYEIITTFPSDRVVWVDSRGKATYIHGDVFRFSCDPSVEHFPFDRHECSLQFMTLDALSLIEYFRQTAIRIGEPLKTLRSIDILDGGDDDVKWIYSSLSPCIVKLGNSEIDVAIFSLNIVRRPEFHILNTIVPVYLLAVWNLFVFFIPVSEQERISYSVTIFLSFTVYIVIVSDGIPETSAPVPKILFFMIIRLLFSGLIATMVIIGAAVYSRDSKYEIPKSVKCFTRFVNDLYIKVSIKLHCHNAKNVDRNEPENLPNASQLKDVLSTDRLDNNHYELAEENNEEIEEIETNSSKAVSDQLNVSWKDVSFAIDLIMFFVFLFLLIVEVILFIILIVSDHCYILSPIAKSC